MHHPHNTAELLKKTRDLHFFKAGIKLWMWTLWFLTHMHLSKIVLDWFPQSINKRLLLSFVPLNCFWLTYFQVLVCISLYEFQCVWLISILSHFFVKIFNCSADIWVLFLFKNCKDIMYLYVREKLPDVLFLQ